MKRQGRHSSKCKGWGEISTVDNSVGDPNPEPNSDPHVFGPSGSGSISQRHGSGVGSFPFFMC